MPAIAEPYDAIAAQIDNLAPRDPNGLGLLSRQPAIDFPTIAMDAPRKQPIVKRQQQIIQQGIIPTYYNLDGPEPGTVVGIVLGSVAGFLLIAWLLFSLTQANRGGGTRTAMAGEEEIVVRRPRRNSQGGRSKRNSMREHSRSPRHSGGSRIIVEDRRVPGDDVVEVIEEHDEYRERRGGGRRGGYR